METQDAGASLSKSSFFKGDQWKSQLTATDIRFELAQERSSVQKIFSGAAASYDAAAFLWENPFVMGLDSPVLKIEFYRPTSIPLEG
jgi:hypothetical protein